EGEVATQTFTVETIDGTEHTITVDIVGVNDASTLTDATDDEGLVTETDTLATLTDNGVLILEDVDGAAEEVFQTDPTTMTSSSTLDNSTGAALGVLTLSAAGAWNYAIANDAVEYLGAGDTATEVFTVKSADGTEHDITITIVGTNDVPVISGTSAGQVTEDNTDDIDDLTGDLTVGAKVDISDVDQDESVFKTDVTAGADNFADGELVIDENGNWTFTIPNTDPLVQG
ncbi:VCBS domain-containing protein, partial [Vibrio sp. 10N.261.51.F12]|uniref:VCBS domain-containing protein n=1 Tax=Vibrio sp. 10N.261.51.F12 TaxID=3229679 RepID=UPI00354B8D24